MEADLGKWPFSEVQMVGGTEPRLCRILDMDFRELTFSRHWCENSLLGGSIFTASGWPGEGHGPLG
jgi:hypothetical protein